MEGYPMLVLTPRYSYHFNSLRWAQDQVPMIERAFFSDQPGLEYRISGDVALAIDQIQDYENNNNLRAEPRQGEELEQFAITILAIASKALEIHFTDPFEWISVDVDFTQEGRNGEHRIAQSGEELAYILRLLKAEEIGFIETTADPACTPQTMVGITDLDEPICAIRAGWNLIDFIPTIGLTKADVTTPEGLIIVPAAPRARTVLVTAPATAPATEALQANPEDNEPKVNHDNSRPLDVHKAIADDPRYSVWLRLDLSLGDNPPCAEIFHQPRSLVLRE